MATIFKALDLQTRHLVVVKAALPEFEGSRGSSARFASEATVIGKMHHPGIPKVISTRPKSRPYLVIEYIEGQTLSDLLTDRGPLPVGEALQFMSGLCDIVEHMHQRGIVHRDLKPGNIIISDDGSPHVIDFGISKVSLGERMILGWMSPKTGTPEYMSPEQIHGDRTDARTDVYSLGAVMYEMITGILPFHGDSPDVIIAGRLSHNPRPPREINSTVTKQVEEIVLHAMAPRRADRYRSAAAMKAEVDFPESIRVTGAYRNPRKPSAWPRRLRVAVFFLSLLGAQVVLFFIFLLVFQDRLAR
jgi:serine/threonine-protein kinase